MPASFRLQKGVIVYKTDGTVLWYNVGDVVQSRGKTYVVSKSSCLCEGCAFRSYGRCINQKTSQAAVGIFSKK